MMILFSEMVVFAGAIHYMIFVKVGRLDRSHDNVIGL
jgi:hypothetical protein